ncbi:SDR family NAD(P)-dependent oxidoreductase [Egicoccus sp. AB-alg6-2]|uniref:SDR family NAD(P)-dependent oxidoreductase n=1 Tax=Egicoccus sp. AB-alg6-2 TaxID=3242692 RepID=UPI00359CD0AD
MGTPTGAVVVVGATSGIGLATARHYTDLGHEVWVTSRDAGRAEETARELGGSARGIALDLADPGSIAGALADVGPVARLVIAAVDRDENTVRDYDLEGAMHLVTLKLVGYTEVVHALVDRLGDDSSIVLFGGLAKDRPYPGSTSVSTVNGGVIGMVHTLGVELAPVRVNAIHPGIVGDTPYWDSKPDGALDPIVDRTPLGRLVTTDEVVHATVFLLENSGVTGVNLNVDGGWMLR